MKYTVFTLLILLCVTLYGQKTSLSTGYEWEKPTIDFLEYAFSERTYYIPMTNGKTLLLEQGGRLDKGEIYILRKGNIRTDTLKYNVPLRFCMDIWQMFPLDSSRFTISTYTTAAELEFNGDEVEVVSEIDYKKSAFKAIKKQYGFDEKPHAVINLGNEKTLWASNTNFLIINGESELLVDYDQYPLSESPWSSFIYQNVFSTINSDILHVWIPDRNQLAVVNLNSLSYEMKEMPRLEEPAYQMNQYFFDRATGKHYLYQFDSREKSKCILSELDIETLGLTKVANVPYALNFKGVFQNKMIVSVGMGEDYAHYLVPWDGNYQKVEVLEDVNVDGQ